MKKYLALFLLILAYSYAHTQIDLGITWQKNVYPLEITSAKISNDGKYVYCTKTNSDANNILKMSLETGLFISKFDNTNYIAKDNIQRLFLSSEGTKLISQSWNTVCIWDVINEKVIKEIYFDSSKGTENGIYHINVTPDGKILAVNFVKSLAQPNGYQSYILLYDLEKYKEISRIPMPDNGTSAEVCLSSDTKLLAVGYNYIRQTFPAKIYAQKVCLLSAESGKLIKEIDKFDNVYFSDQFYSIGFSPNDSLIYYNPSVQFHTRMINIYSSEYVFRNDLEPAYIYNVFPNNINYLVNKGNNNLELYQNTKKINSFKITPIGSDVKQINKKIKIFNYGNDEISILDEILLSVENIISNITLNYNILNNQLLIQNNQSQIQYLKIFDINGKILYNQINLSSNYVNTMLNTGIYICAYKINEKDYTQKFQVVR